MQNEISGPTRTTGRTNFIYNIFYFHITPRTEFQVPHHSCVVSFSELQLAVQCLSPDRYVFLFLGNFQKLSTKNTTKLEMSSDRYVFFDNMNRNDLVVGIVLVSLKRARTSFKIVYHILYMTFSQSRYMKYSFDPNFDFKSNDYFAKKQCKIK